MREFQGQTNRDFFGTYLFSLSLLAFVTSDKESHELNGKKRKIIESLDRQFAKPKKLCKILCFLIAS